MKKVLRTILAFVVLSIGFEVLEAQEQQAHQMLAKQDRHYFIENKGQWHSDVLYLARMGDLDAWITKYGVNYTSTSWRKWHHHVRTSRCIIVVSLGKKITTCWGIVC